MKRKTNHLSYFYDGILRRQNRLQAVPGGISITEKTE